MDPNSDLEANLVNLDLLDQRGAKVTIDMQVTMTIHTLLAWAECFLVTCGEYPGLYDLLDTSKCVFLAEKLHLRNSTLPMPLLPQSRDPYPSN